jgi:hypothetical protein
MPAQPLPAKGAGKARVVYQDQKHQLRAIVYAKAATGAWVQVDDFFVSYPQTQAMLARLEGIPGPTELGYVDSIDELGALGDRIKKAARAVAKSKAFQAVKKVGKIVAPIAAAVVPGGQAITAASLAVKVGKKVASNRKAAKKPAAPKAAAQPAPAAAKPSALARAPKMRAALAAVKANGGKPKTQEQARALAAAKVLAAKPPEEREQAAAKAEARVDAFKVIAPNGDVVWVPREEVAA